MTAAAEIRAAAQAIRANAQAATPGPWEPMVLGSEGYAVVQIKNGKPSITNRRRRPATCVMEPFETCKADAAHIAGMHPGVAVAVADWLTFEALTCEMAGETEQTRHALAVARAYLASTTGPEVTA